MVTSSARIVSLVLQIATIASLVLVWQWAALSHPAPYLPPLEAIARGYWRLVQGDLLFVAVLPSLYRLLVGFLAAVVLGVIAGLAIGYLRALDPWVRPILEYLRFIPAVAILPAALLLLGPTDAMRIFVIAFGSIFPVLLAAIDGARRVDPTLLDVARVNGLSTVQQIVRVVMPAALPSIFAGIRIALGLALIMMVISELIAADDGIGFYILRSQRLFQTAGVYAGVLVIGTIGWALTAGLLAFEKRVLAWHRGWRGLTVASGNA
ncbi:ABC transporter permease [Pseudorhodoplanes sp.]|uniref:ABC transporter permease n=1 Tax=Pseudorhodoplanes sp. TaxID=1934341 RepID=UPI002C63D387|nr:ABC transporter permease [Pseudorhodoplanes sp.]HWM83736.1 ABC transporter permease [Pseudolabrys sp.]HWV55394.1 ABC transporter permease [Pseudorhodoplanes sp.]